MKNVKKKSVFWKGEDFGKVIRKRIEL